MMGETNDIFLVAGDALVYLTEPMHKKYSTKYYLMTDFSTPLLLYAPVHNFDDLPSIPSVAHVLNGRPISQPKNK